MRRLLACLVLLIASLVPLVAVAQSKRDARFEWDEGKQKLLVTLQWRDVLDAEIRKKTKRGFPTTVIFTATVHRPGVAEPVASTIQTCKITWHVWDEAWLVEIVRAGSKREVAKPTWKAVLRVCGETARLVAADSTQVPVGAPVYLKVKVQVNPASPELIAKIKRWRSQASATGVAAAGDTLFSTFTGLFLAPIDTVDRSVEFTTKTSVPSVPKPKNE